MPVTLKDIATRLGKSITTVSRALNGYEDVSLATRELVQQTAEEMGYHPNTFAQRLQKQHTDLLGVILPVLGSRSTDMFLSEFLSGVGTGAREFGYDLLVALHYPGQEEMNSYRNMVQSQLVDGFVLTRTRLKDPRIQYLKKEGIPFVTYGRTSGTINFPYIDIDGEDALRQITEYLIMLGHRKIACIASSKFYNFTESRLTGYIKTMEKYNLPVPEEYITYGGLLQESGYHHGGQLLDLENRPTAIIAFNDMMAYGCLLAAQERELNVPEDLSVTGFDDLALSATSSPPLTTMVQPVFDIGEKLGAMLIDVIHKQNRFPRNQVMKSTLVVRNSCASPKNVNQQKIIPLVHPLITHAYDEIKRQIEPWVTDEIIHGFGITSQIEKVEQISFQCTITKVIFPNRAGEYIEDIESLPSQFDYVLTYPGTASTKSMVLYFSDNEGVFIGAKPSPEFARIGIHKISGNRVEITYQSTDNKLIFLPFTGSWKQVLPVFREHFNLPSHAKVLRDPLYMLQTGITSTDGYCELTDYHHLLPAYRQFRSRMGRNHIVHFYGLHEHGYLRNNPDVTLKQSLGGEKAFSQLLKTINGYGLRTSGHFNPRLADYDWVNNNKEFRAAIVRDDFNHMVIEDIDGHPFYVMNPANNRWYDVCLEQIFRLKEYGFDFIQLSQFSQARNFKMRFDVIHAAYQQLLAEIRRHKIPLWISGLSDLYSLEKIYFSQFLRRDRQTYWSDGEPRGQPIYGPAYPEFFTSLYQGIQMAYPVIGDDAALAPFDHHFSRARMLQAQVYDFQSGYYRDGYTAHVDEICNKIDENR